MSHTDDTAIATESFLVSRTVTRCFRALDERHFDPEHFSILFADAAEMVRPNGVPTVGPAAISSSHERSFERFEATQHLLSEHDLMLEGNTAVYRANLVAIHIWNDVPSDAPLADRTFTAGGVVTAVLVNTDRWRISRIENRVVWRLGEFGNMAQTR